MKKKIVKYCILFLLLTSFSIFSFKVNYDNVNSENNNSFPINPKQSGSWYISGRIIIDNNWTDVELMYEWCSGNGSEVSPYIIENLTINAQFTGSCIEIRNSSDYFTIQNSSFSYSGDREELDGAIKLYNTTNGKIVSNNCSNNIMHGILLTNGCSKNNISNNFIFNNTRGISLYNNCSKNTFFNNTMRNCTFTGINIAGPSERNQILNNSISDCSEGISILNENHTLLSNNNIFECNYAIEISSVSYFNVSYNRINSCAVYGIKAFYFNSSFISDNIISNMVPRGTAILVLDSHDSIISNNILLDNRGWQISLSTGNNVSIIENLILIEIEFDDYGDTMVSISSSKFCDISRNQIIKNTTQGSQRMHGLGMWHCSNNNVTENIIFGLILEGLYLEKSNRTDITANIIITSNYGIRLNDSSNYNEIFYNEVSITETIGGEKGISLENFCHYNTLLNNIVNGSEYNTENYGIYLSQSNNNIIIQNYVIDNVYGIYLIKSNFTTVLENIIQDFDECITEIECVDNIIEDNQCINETTRGIPGFHLIIIMGIFCVTFILLMKKVFKFQIRRLEVSS